VETIDISRSWTITQNFDLGSLRELEVIFNHSGSTRAEAKLNCPILSKVSFEAVTAAQAIDVLATLRTDVLQSVSVEFRWQMYMGLPGAIHPLDSDSLRAFEMKIELPSVRSVTYVLQPGGLSCLRYLHSLTPNTPELRLTFGTRSTRFPYELDSPSVVKDSFRALCASLQPNAKEGGLLLTSRISLTWRVRFGLI
jgi:hypothetical protein